MHDHDTSTSLTIDGGVHFSELKMAASMDDFKPRVVLPGDSLMEHIPGELHGKITLGPGLRQDETKIFSTKAGILKQKNPHTFWIDCHQKRVNSDTHISMWDCNVIKLNSIEWFWGLNLKNSPSIGLMYINFEDSGLGLGLVSLRSVISRPRSRSIIDLIIET